jgi:hypothetical protein
MVRPVAIADKFLVAGAKMRKSTIPTIPTIPTMFLFRFRALQGLVAIVNFHSSFVVFLL